MKKLMTIFSIVILVLNCKGQNNTSKSNLDSSDSDWKKFEFREMTVSLNFPTDEIQTYNDTLKTEKHGITIRKTIQWKSLDKGSALNTFYTYNYYQYPDYNFKSTEVEDFLRNKINVIVSDLNAELGYVKNIKRNKHSGLEFVYSINEYGVTITQRIFMVNNFEFSVSVFTKKPFENNPSINKFLNSFKWSK